jgi:pimeloyl-ACP methyl ester carboxylesterase
MRSLLVALTTFALLACTGGEPPPPAPDCRVGAYRLDDGRTLDLAPTLSESVRWRLMDGTTGSAPAREGAHRTTDGWTGQPGPHTLELFGCDAGRIRFDGVDGARVALHATDTTFESDGVTLAGRLVMPPGAEAAPVIVLISGSETDSALQWTFRQRLYPAQGVGVFVYDKRGTGGSGGEYSEDVHLLARDAAAAAREARRLAGSRLGRLGYLGGSEGGTVAPIAQTLEPADFVVVEYGLAISPMHIDRDLIVEDLRAAGYGPEVQAEGAAFGEAIAVLVASDYREGWDEFIALRNRYRREDWFQHVEGDYADAFAKTPPWLGRVIFPVMDWASGAQVDWDYDPMAVLRSIDAPMLWIVAGADRTSPQHSTRARLVELQQEGRDIVILDFPHSDHGIMEYPEPNDGSQPPLRYSAGYLDAALDFALGRPGADAP